MTGKPQEAVEWWEQGATSPRSDQNHNAAMIQKNGIKGMNYLTGHKA
jgi:hypothetical protein